MCTIDHRICEISNVRYEFQLGGGIRFNNHANSQDESWWQWVGSKTFMLISESRGIEVAREVDSWSARLSSSWAWTSPSKDDQFLPKPSLFRLSSRSLPVHPRWYTISNWWAVHFPPIPMMEKLSNCSCQTALDIRYSMRTGQEVKLVTDYHFQQLLSNRSPVAYPAQARRSQIVIPADCSWYTMNSNSWAWHISSSTCPFNASQFFLTSGSGKAELLSMHPELWWKESRWKTAMIMTASSKKGVEQ